MRPLPRAIGLVAMLVGGVWLLQGIGFLEGSAMSHNPWWAVLGGAVLVAGLVVFYRENSRAQALIAAERAELTPPTTDE